MAAGAGAAGAGPSPAHLQGEGEARNQLPPTRKHPRGAALGQAPAEGCWHPAAGRQVLEPAVPGLAPQGVQPQEGAQSFTLRSSLPKTVLRDHKTQMPLTPPSFQRRPDRVGQPTERGTESRQSLPHMDQLVPFRASRAALEARLCARPWAPKETMRGRSPGCQMGSRKDLRT